MPSAVPPDGSLIPRFGRARRDPELAVLEGLHPLKHALRFGASVLEVVCEDLQRLGRLACELAPDVRTEMLARACEVSAEVFAELAPLTPATGVIAIAERPRPVNPDAVFADPRAAPVVLLEDPRDLGNLGACIRVAAAADAAGVLTIAGHDPWHPDALRGSAGLNYALPVARLPDGLPPALGRPLLALDPGGEPLQPGVLPAPAPPASAPHASAARAPGLPAPELPARAVLAFGTERHGLTSELLARADARIAIPMRPGVSSLNLATSVAAVLFAWRLSRRP